MLTVCFSRAVLHDLDSSFVSSYGDIVSTDLHSPVFFIFPWTSIIGTVRKIRASRVIRRRRKAVSTGPACPSTAEPYKGLHL